MVTMRTNVEEVEIASQPPSAQTAPCAKCSRPATLDKRARYEYRDSAFDIDFVFPGWACSKCGTVSPPTDALELISKFLDERFVSLGRRPRVDRERVLAIRCKEEERRQSARLNGRAS